MADALVGGAFLSAFLQVLFDRIASPEVADYISGRKINDGLLQKLKITLLSVNTVLDDAEEKQVMNPAVKMWLDELKDAVYDAEDLLDEIATDAMQNKLDAECQSSSWRQVRMPTLLNPFEKGISSQIEEILAKLEFLVKQKEVLGLKEVKGNLLHRLPTTSLVEQSSVYGRDDDKEAIINQLLLDDVCSDGPDVIAIVGMAGVGKTTLAQLAYNDARVCNCFDLKSWIYVSVDYDVFRMTKTILEAVTSSTCDMNDLNFIQLQLQERLTDRKILLVLDDVWNESYIEWEPLQIPLKSAAPGSKILVTTRNERVVSAMHSVSTHQLKQLSDENCWLLFARHAFANENSEAHSELEVIGRKIAKNCNGLPLAAKTLGSILYSKLDLEDWNTILNSNFWDLPGDKGNILPALRLSYLYLPSHLKRCFAYCAIFPKNYEFHRQSLIQQWMAEDLLRPSSKNKTMEGIGTEYFHNLLSRSFFQPSSRGEPYFIMHGLFNDLAKFVSGEFCCRVDKAIPPDNVRKTRHLSYTRTRFDASSRFEAFFESRRLRTFFPVKLPSAWKFDYYLSRKVTHDLVPALKHLRFLSLSGYSNVTDLPDAIGNLKQLRYFILSYTAIKKLPESICNLHNLQSLNLYSCSNLIELPTNMGRLMNLHFLNIEKTKLRKLPSQISKLKNLQQLSTYIVGKHDGLGIRDLRKFEHLHRNLSILELQNVINAEDASEANLKDKKYLTDLSLSWSTDADDSESARHVLENLQPSANLEKLSIINYGGTRFPDWLGSFSFSKMVSVNLSFCKYCIFLPPLGQLPYLKEISIVGCEGVEEMGTEFYGNNSSQSTPFGSLRILKFKNMLAWKKWISLDSVNGGGAFTCLEELSIQNCPNLTGDLPCHLPSLKKLVVINCKKLRASSLRALKFRKLETGNCNKLVFEELPSTLTKLSIKGSIRHSLLTSFPLDLLSQLQNLNIENCPKLASFSISEGAQQDLTSLRHLRIKRCANFLSFLQGGLHSSNLRTLSVENCKNLISLPELMSTLLPSLHYLSIANCPKLVTLPEGGLPSCLHILRILGCDNLIASRMDWGLQRLSSLKHLTLHGEYEDMEHFPEEGLLPAALTSLWISKLRNLRSLNNKGLQQLTSLQDLWIVACRKLQSIPEEGLPASLRYLNISSCPLLKERCQKETGKYWKSIAGISCIEIDGEVIML